ncbi:MAG TPA: hypothetical protein VK338_00140, partial [Candidatus Nitrosocosmicus sp.]|nr:hypothetical protein [Candidatus Nitrosocosmicus sp.]
MDPNYPDQKLEPVLDYTPLPQTSPPKSKSKLPLIIIGIFLLLLMGSGSYLLTKKAKESKKTAEPVPTRKIITPTLQVAPKLNDETVNWEMISNKEYSFRVPESIRCNGCYSNDEVETRITGNEWTIKVNKIEGKYLPLNSQFTYSTVDIFFNDFLTMQIGQNKTVSSNSLN